VSPEEEIRRAERANAITQDEIYVEAMETLKKGVIDLWASCPARDKDGREWLWQQYQAALRFEQAMQEIMNTGKLAAEAKKRSMVERALNLVGAK
jgi:hypothetical protein